MKTTATKGKDQAKPKTKTKAKRAAKERFHVIHFTNPSGHSVFRVAGYKADGSRVRENYKTQEEAIAAKANLDLEVANFQTDIVTRMKPTTLSDSVLRSFESAYAIMQANPLLRDKDPIFLAEFTTANYRAPINKITVLAAYDLFIAEREKQNRRPDTIRNLKGRLGMFHRLYGAKNVSDLTSDDCRDFVMRDNTGPRTQINNRLAGSNFLNWCLRRKYTDTNPMLVVDKPATDSHEPSVLAVHDCRRLLSAAQEYNQGVLLPYVAISLFAGLRPAEVARLTWDRIDLEEKTITLDGSMAKTRQRRIVKLSDNALDWLTPMAIKKPAFVPAAFARHFGRVKKAAGYGNEKAEQEKREAAAAKKKASKTAEPVAPAKKTDKTEKAEKLRPWVQDYMRHTAVSMFLATNKHEGEAATWAGNSPNILHKHYKGLVKEADAKEFWAITPKTVKSPITKLPTTAKAAQAAA